MCMIFGNPNKHNLLFFKTLKNITNFKWTPECQKDFEELKIDLSSSKIYHIQENMKAFSFTLGSLIRSIIQYWLKKNKGIQHPIYYLSWTLLDAETIYLKAEKVVLVLVSS